MKKLLIIATVLSTLFAEAAAFSWEISGESSAGKIYNTADQGANYKVMNNASTFGSWTYTDAMLFCSSTTGGDVTPFTQAALLTALTSGSSVEDAWDTITSGAGKKSISSTTVSSSVLTTQSFNYGSDGNDYGYYMAILAEDGDGNYQVLISDTVVAQALEGKTDSVDFAKPGGETGWSKHYYASGSSFSSAGWYSVSVPEPTSGLLLLCGLAGLMLRRKQKQA